MLPRLWATGPREMTSPVTVVSPRTCPHYQHKGRTLKIYSNTLTMADIRAAFRAARTEDGQDIYLEDPREFEPKGANRGRRGFEIFAHSLYRKQASGHRPIGSYPLSLENGSDVNRAASWTAYGYVIARLFAMDPKARIGQYGGARDFVRQVEAQAAHRARYGDHTRFLDLVKVTA